MSKFYKKSGILDLFQKTLPVDVWQPDGLKILPHVRTEILNRLYKFIPKESLREIHVIGAITGYQYTETTDIDLNVSLESQELVNQLWEVRRGHNGKILQGTRRAVNYFLLAYKGEDQSWRDSYFGIYDLLGDHWIIPPPLPADTRDPKIQYKLELNIASMFVRKFMRQVDEYYSDMRKYNYIKNNMKDGWEKNVILTRKERELKITFNEMVQFIQQLDQTRKFEYSWGWGIPRTNFRNILYKFISESIPEKYIKFFEMLETITLPKVDPYNPGYIKLL